MSTYQEHLAGLTCPDCGYPLAEAPYPPLPRAPGPRDFIICFNCGAIAVFGAGARSVRRPTAGDLFREAFEHLARLEHAELAQETIRARGPIWPEGEGVAT